VLRTVCVWEGGGHQGHCAQLKQSLAHSLYADGPIHPRCVPKSGPTLGSHPSSVQHTPLRMHSYQ
jgi:hypothetical protein